MTIIDSIKPFWPVLFTVVLPKAISYYRAVKTSVRTRPPPRPLTNKAQRSLNILFVSICICLWVSLSARSGDNGLSNIFATTGTRLGAPTDLLFSRLAALRKDHVLTAEDEVLKSKFISMPLRQIYLRHGPAPLLACDFCHPDNPITYTLHALPTQILTPHLFHFLVFGLATSKSIAGPVAASFRFRLAFLSMALFACDLYLNAFGELDVNVNRQRHPFSLYTASAIFRPLLFCALDIILAFLIYVSATNRFLLFPFLADASGAGAEAANAEELMEKTKFLLQDTSLKLQVGAMKLRGLNITRNAIVRDEVLKRDEDRYWSAARQMEREQGGVLATGSDIDQTLFEEEEVQEAVARAFGSGGLDVGALRREADGFVREATRSLDTDANAT